MPATNKSNDDANNQRNDEKLSSATGALNNKKDDEATYFKLLCRNRPFRLYITSYVITHTGEFLTYIASIALTEELLSTAGTTSRTTISILVVVRLLPNVLLSVLGGILADGRDRRESMILLDILGAISPLLFLVAMHFQSIPLIFAVTFIQQCIAGLYEPCRSAIIPLLVPEEDYLKKATTLAGLAWSIFTAVGSSLGGFVLTWFGFKACFCKYINCLPVDSTVRPKMNDPLTVYLSHSRPCSLMFWLLRLGFNHVLGKCLSYVSCGWYMECC